VSENEINIILVTCCEFCRKSDENDSWSLIWEHVCLFIIKWAVLPYLSLI